MNNSGDNSLLKNILFGVVVLTGMLAVGYVLIRPESLPQPQSFAPASEARLSIEQVAAKVDAAIEEELADLRTPLTTTPYRADDLTVARRLTLSLAGTLPSVEEIRQLEQIDPGHRTHWFVSRLLEDRRTSYHLAERFARAYVGVDEGPFLVYRRERFVEWLNDQIFHNRPYDDLAREILTGDGLWTDDPSVNFYTAVIDEETGKPDPIRLAGRTSRAFLGMRIDCLQCHDDFLGTMELGSDEDPRDGEQVDFHMLAAFFSDVQNSLAGIKTGVESDYEYELLGDDEATIIEASPPLYEDLMGEEPDLRSRLANWVTHEDNRPFVRATINRVWAIMFNKPLVEPVDNISIVGPWPEAMEVLCDDFIDSDFDLHRLIRVIAATEAFHRSSEAPFDVTDKHTEYLAVFPLTRLRPDQVAGAIVQSTSLSTVDSTSNIVTRLTSFGQQNDFVTRYGDAGEDEFADRGETVTQRLLMFNGDMIRERLDNGLNSPARTAGLSPDMKSAVEVTFLATLSRAPDQIELQHFMRQYEGLGRSERSTKIVDLYWGLINSTEFGWNR
ncbi:MAG: DUF1553 domain-containing protein [Planctomycetota bacterium]